MRLTSDATALAAAGDELAARRLALGASCLGRRARVTATLIDFDPFHGGEVSYPATPCPIAALLVLAGFCLQPLRGRAV